MSYTDASNSKDNVCAFIDSQSRGPSTREDNVILVDTVGDEDDEKQIRLSHFKTENGTAWFPKEQASTSLSTT